MILLPSGPKILLPQKRAEWSPSLSLRRDALGNEVTRIRFLLKGRTSDGFVKKFWFEDRDDADAFLHAIVTETIQYQPALWRLPTPNWHPDIGEGLSYEFATVTYLTSTTQATYTKPSDWNDADNYAVCIGGGASGGVSNRSTSTNANASGGGGGGFGGYLNLTLTGNATYQCGAGGAARNRTTSGNTAGAAGSDSYFNGTDYASAPVGGTGGVAGKAAFGTATASGGGSGKGSWFNDGGSSGAAAATANSQSATGGGGAASSGGNGGASSGTSNSTGRSATAGGNAGSGGGTGGASSTSGNATVGNDGFDYGSAGAGGGGGGASTAVGIHGAGATGGNYGGGGGGASSGSTSTADTNVTSGAGQQGNVIVAYTPAVAASGFNLAMIGM